MALILADRVWETTTTTGTGAVTLAGAVSGYRTFASQCANNDTIYYTIDGGGQWEVGLGTFTSAGNTLARTTVLDSSNANALVSFSAGTKNVYAVYPGDAPGMRKLIGVETIVTPLQFGAAGNGTTDDLAAWNSLLTYVSSLLLVGYTCIQVDGGGRTYGLSNTLNFGNDLDNVVVTNCAFKPTGILSNWTETDSAVITYWKNNQTFGTGWITQKPLLAIGSTNPGFVMRDVGIDCLRLCAGIYIFGGSKQRFLQNVIVDNVRSYGIYMTGSMGMNNVKVRINTDSAGTRDAYGIGYDAIDTHWRGVSAQWGHCPLLTTGATLMMSDCDIFNGSNNSVSPITNPRLWEHRGNTITWLGGRLGNGVIHVWNTDLTIHPAKIGVTNTANITEYIKFYSTKASQTVDNFTFYPAEIPTELRQGSTNQFGFVNPTTFTATVTASSPTLTSVSSVANLNVGQALTGAGLGAGAKIAAIDSVAMTITMTVNAVTGGTGIVITPAGAWDTNSVTNMASKNGYHMVIPRGLEFVATENNNVYPIAVNNAPGSNSLIRFRAGGSAAVPEVGLRSNAAYLGYSSALGITVNSAGVLNAPNGASITGNLGIGTTGPGYNLEVIGTMRVSGNAVLDSLIFRSQTAPTSKAAAATLTGAELITGILQYTGAAATITLPLGTAIETATTWPRVGIAIDWSVINTGTEACTIGANGNTTVGSLTVANGTSGMFRIRRTSANTFVIYRIS